MDGGLRRAGWAAGVIALGAACAAASPDDGAAPSADPAWVLVWQDEFDGDALDRTRWAPEESCWGGGNDERQCYTDREANVAVGGGVLRLTARPEVHRGPTHPPELAHLGQGTREQAYTSGKVRTRGLADWRYGRFSARMKLPAGQGTWPAFWMMPTEAAYGRWPRSGEIDVMEAVNLGTPCEDCAREVESRTSGALHFGDLPPGNDYLFAKAPEMAHGTPADGWRTYAVEWAADTIQWFVDGEVFLRLTADDWRTASPGAAGRPGAPFDRPFYLMANLAVGGRLPEQSNGAGFDPGAFPAELLIDWVRVEQCVGDATGTACLTDAEWNGTPQGPWEVQAR